MNKAAIGAGILGVLIIAGACAYYYFFLLDCPRPALLFFRPVMQPSVRPVGSQS